MITRLYVHNFRCLENFELKLAGRSSTLLIGKNGSGKSTIYVALEILQTIARGTSQLASLLLQTDFSQGRSNTPMRFEIGAALGGQVYGYTLAVDLITASRGLPSNPSNTDSSSSSGSSSSSVNITTRPTGELKRLRVLEERLTVDSITVFSRKRPSVQTALAQEDDESRLMLDVDWQLVAFPLLQERSPSDPLYVFKTWLARMIILAPIPAEIRGVSHSEYLTPNRRLDDFGAWFSGLLAFSPAAYSRIDAYLKTVMPDFRNVKNPLIAEDFRSLTVQFQQDGPELSINFEYLSDGEKCFFICALVLAANESYGPLFCFWDEPDNYLSISEVGQFVMALRRSFENIGGQLVVTSHNPETIRTFSGENTMVMGRRNHLEPAVARPLEEIHVNGDLINALILDEVEPWG